MKRVIVVLALMALALPMAAWAQSITVENRTGTAVITGMNGTGGLGTIGVSAIASSPSELTEFDGFTAPSKRTTLGYVNFSTGVLESGSISGGGTFSNAGSSFNIIGLGSWMEGLTPPVEGKILLFNGSFSGPIAWSETSAAGSKYTYSLSGPITGVLWDGSSMTGTATEDFYTVEGQLLEGTVHITVGNATLGVPLV